jgi:hypothetical protein
MKLEDLIETLPKVCVKICRFPRVSEVSVFSWKITDENIVEISKNGFFSNIQEAKKACETWYPGIQWTKGMNYIVDPECIAFGIMVIKK